MAVPGRRIELANCPTTYLKHDRSRPVVYGRGRSILKRDLYRTKMWGKKEKKNEKGMVERERESWTECRNGDVVPSWEHLGGCKSMSADQPLSA